jgi:putative nucleotidyltransferase with HDIG domain
MRSENYKEHLKRSFDHSHRFRWGLLIATTLIFIIALYPNLVMTKHSYNIGDIAEHDIKAPKEFFIEDSEATEANRQRAVEGVLTIYDYDSELATSLNARVKQAFADLRSIIEETRKKQNSENSSLENLSSSPSLPIDGDILLREKILQRKEEFETKIGISISDGAYKILVQEEFSVEIANHITKIISQILKNGVVTNKAILLREAEKGVVFKDVSTKKERTVAKLKQFYGLDRAKTMVRIVGQPLLKDLDYTMRNLVVDLVQGLIQPNITLNRSETEERKKRAAAEIKPTLYKIKAGEMLLREGERVTQVQLLKLNALESQTKKEHVVASSIGAAMLILCLLISTYILHIHQHRLRMDNHNKNLLFITSVLIAFYFFAAAGGWLSESLVSNSQSSIAVSSMMYGIPLASGAMIICVFMGFDLAIPFATVLAICSAVLFQNRFEFFIYFLISGMMAAYWIRNCRERKVFIKAGAKLSLLNVLLVTALEVYLPEFSLTKLLWAWAFAFMGGIGAGIVTAGLIPLVEIAFDYPTDIKLLELANLDQPILRRLMIEAPGSYHHSVIVGSMVEAAATEIGSNPLLAKVCGYYHDIGKIKKPLYFIENQTNGKNKHDKLEPSMSSLILISHIKDGVEIAKENKLGQVIIESIKQHHGTSLITYFYDKAKQRKGDGAVKIDDYRYPGPRPQTSEIALVMLADVIEATSRTLANPTPSRVQGLVQNLINKIFSDGQLDDCELTLKDLHKIAKSFNKILNGIHHHRIEYPESHLSGNGKVKNGSPDRQPARQVRVIEKENPEKSPSHLRRLGQS